MCQGAAALAFGLDCPRAPIFIWSQCDPLLVPATVLARGSEGFPRICVDAPGFDRVAFHKDFNAAIISFLRGHLPGVEKP
jgi:hypothetical protein